jgi:hypothetical protein
VIVPDEGPRVIVPVAGAGLDSDRPLDLSKMKPNVMSPKQSSPAIPISYSNDQAALFDVSSGDGVSQNGQTVKSTSTYAVQFGHRKALG